jgi:hypothetical protein
LLIDVTLHIGLKQLTQCHPHIKTKF